MKHMTLTAQQKEQIVYKIKAYFAKELDEEIGQFDAEFLLEFFGNEVGPYFYNKGIQDAQRALGEHMDRLNEALYTLEEPLG